MQLFNDWQVGETFTFFKQEMDSALNPRLVDFGIDDLEAKIDDRDEIIAKLEAENAQLTTKVEENTSLTAELSDKDDKISALTVEKASLSAKVAALSDGCPEK